MKQQSYINNQYSWLDNFPKEHQEKVMAYERDISSQNSWSAKRSLRYQKLYGEEKPTPTPSVAYNNNAHLQNANRSYFTQENVDRRKADNESGFCVEKCRRSQKYTADKSIAQFSTLRDFVLDDAIEKRKRLFNQRTILPPLQVDGLDYSVLIGDDFMFIGCIERSIEQWNNISDREVLAMDGKIGLHFWQQNKAILLEKCEQHQQKIRLNNHKALS